MRRNEMLVIFNYLIEVDGNKFCEYNLALLKMLSNPLINLWNVREIDIKENKYKYLYKFYDIKLWFKNL